jgi:hypothetical protein
MTAALRRLALVSVTLLLCVPLADRADAAVTTPEAQRLTELVNTERAAVGAAPLTVDSRLVAIAAAWTAHMATTGSMVHNPDLQALAPAGWTKLTENLGAGFTVEQIHASLMADPAHKANILDPDVNAIGVATVSNGRLTWVTEDFMKVGTVVPNNPPGGGAGYRLVGANGGVFTFGSAAAQTPVTSAAPIVGGAASPTGQGYWLVDSAGRVQGRGDAPSLGGLDGKQLAAPIVGMAATPSGKGYWLLGRDGGVFTFGDAVFYGSTGAIRLNRPVVGMASSPSGKGYWFVASDGGIFAYGDAPFEGSTGAMRLNQPIVGMAPSADGSGYWLVARDGGIFAFGTAPFKGSTGAIVLNQPIVGMTATASGKGYHFVAADGGVFSFGDAVFLGSLGSALPGGAPIVAMLAAA